MAAPRSSGQERETNTTFPKVPNAPRKPSKRPTANLSGPEPGQPAATAKNPAANIEMCRVCHHGRDMGDMILCKGEDCGVWQHSHCVGFVPLPVTDHWFCDLCRIERADPFWMPVSPNLGASARLPEGSAASVKKAVFKFNLSKEQVQLCGREDHQLQLACILLGDSLPFRMNWPRHADLEINMGNHSPYSRSKHRKLGMYAVDEPFNLSPYVKEASNLVSLSGIDRRPFCIALQLMKRRSVDDVKAMMAPPETAEQALLRVCCETIGRPNELNDDEGFEISSTVLSLRDPNTSTRIKTPVRFLGGGGIVAFDLDSYLEVVERSRKWLCLFSAKASSIQELQLDGFLGPVLAALKAYPAVMEVEVSSDAAWRPAGSIGRWNILTEDPHIVAAALAEGANMVRKTPVPSTAHLVVDLVSEEIPEPVLQKAQKTEVILLLESDSEDTGEPHSRRPSGNLPEGPAAQGEVSSSFAPLTLLERGARSGAQLPPYHPYGHPSPYEHSAVPTHIVPPASHGVPYVEAPLPRRVSGVGTKNPRRTPPEWESGQSPPKKRFGRNWPPTLLADAMADATGVIDRELLGGTAVDPGSVSGLRKPNGHHPASLTVPGHHCSGFPCAHLPGHVQAIACTQPASGSPSRSTSIVLEVANGSRPAATQGPQSHGNAPSVPPVPAWQRAPSQVSVLSTGSQSGEGLTLAPPRANETGEGIAQTSMELHMYPASDQQVAGAMGAQTRFTHPYHPPSVPNPHFGAGIAILPPHYEPCANNDALMHDAPRPSAAGPGYMPLGSTQPDDPPRVQSGAICTVALRLENKSGPWDASRLATVIARDEAQIVPREILREQERSHIPRDFSLLPPLDQAPEPGHQERRMVVDTKVVELGRHQFHTRYWTPDSTPYAAKDKLYICEFCLKSFTAHEWLCQHMAKCSITCPPGDEIYRSPSPTVQNEGNPAIANPPISVFEVNGSKHKAYCRALCGLTKLLLNEKHHSLLSLANGVERFLFYVLCKKDGLGYHVMGYFSKHKLGWGYNLSCILMLPPYQRKGYGRFLIAFSYKLSWLDGRLGTPERPLSNLGRATYQKYWTRVVLETVHQHRADISIKELSEDMGICQEDVINTLGCLGMLRYWNGKPFIEATRQVVENHLKTTSRGITIDPRRINYTPYGDVANRRRRH